MNQMQTPDEQHEAIQLLLPWYASGQLDLAERTRVAEHLARCADCRAEVEVQQALARAVIVPAPAPDVGWQKLAARLGRAAAPAPRRRVRAWTRANGGATRHLRWLVAGQSAAIAVLAAWIAVPLLSPETHDGKYRALSAEAPATDGNVLAMFRPAATEAQLRQVLTTSGVRIVNGPTSAGAYVLATPAGGEALAALRRDPIVTLAEPMGAPAAP